MARRRRAVVAQLRQRDVGIRHRRLHEPARSQHQRCAHRSRPEDAVGPPRTSADPARCATMTRMQVSELWRYPIKSLHGEPLAHAALGADGVQGDRLVHVRGNRGLLTGRTRSQLLRLRATTGPDGRPYVDDKVDVLEGAPAQPPPHLGGWVTGAPYQITRRAAKTARRGGAP